MTTNDARRALEHELTVKSLLFAFEILELSGFKPMDDEEAGVFWIADLRGQDLTPSEYGQLGQLLMYLKGWAPQAVWALYARGTSSGEGVDAGGALLEAMDRWKRKR